MVWWWRNPLRDRRGPRRCSRRRHHGDPRSVFARTAIRHRGRRDPRPVQRGTHRRAGPGGVHPWSHPPDPATVDDHPCSGSTCATSTCARRRAQVVRRRHRSADAPLTPRLAPGSGSAAPPGRRRRPAGCPPDGDRSRHLPRRGAATSLSPCGRARPNLRRWVTWMPDRALRVGGVTRGCSWRGSSPTRSPPRSLGTGFVHHGVLPVAVDDRRGAVAWANRSRACRGSVGSSWCSRFLLDLSTHFGAGRIERDRRGPGTEPRAHRSGDLGSTALAPFTNRSPHGS